MPDQAVVDILIKIREDLAGLNRTREGMGGLRKDAESLAETFKRGLGIGTGMEIARRGIDLLARGLKDSVGAAFELAEHVKDQSEALGMTAEAYQVVRYQMAQAGVDTGRLTIAISSQNQSLAAARAGAADASEAYRTLGLSVSQVEQLSPERRLEVVARSTLNATDKTKAFQAASQILGSRGLPQLLNSLRTLAADGYDNVASSAKAAGVIMENSLVEMLDKNKKRIDNFKNFALPVATGEAISLVQGAMDFVGSTAGNITNGLAGRVIGDLNTPDAGTKLNAPTGPSFASDRDVLTMRAALAQQKAAQIQSASLLDETQKRQALLPILKEQEGYYSKMIELQFGDADKSLPVGQVTDEQLQRYKQRNELEAKLVAIRQQLNEVADTPVSRLVREFGDTSTMISESFAGGLSSAVSGLADDVWRAEEGTQSWGQAWSNLKNLALQTLSQIITKMIVMQALNSALGLFGYSAGGSGVTKIGPTVFEAGSATASAAGGGQFMTSGPTTFTVGDNPGGIELVSVLPISGVGRSTINGRALKMAGGGSAVVMGGQRGGGAPVNVVFNFSTGVAATVRAEIAGMIPQLRALAVDAVQEGYMRNQISLG